MPSAGAIRPLCVAWQQRVFMSSSAVSRRAGGTGASDQQSSRCAVDAGIFLSQLSSRTCLPVTTSHSFNPTPVGRPESIRPVVDASCLPSDEIVMLLI